MRFAYIAHPIAGPVKKNIARVERIIEHLLQSRSKVWPIAPYLDACRYLDDESQEDRNRAFKANERYFSAGVIDELWVCGPQSAGVKLEIQWAVAAGISVLFKDFSEHVD